MNKTTKILIVMAVLIFALSPLVAGMRTNAELFTLGNAERTYQDGMITCYLGTLFPGMPIFWCGYMKNEQFVMIHSYFANQVPLMNQEMSAYPTFTLTAMPKK